MSDEPENGEQQLTRPRIKTSALDRLPLDGGNYAVLEQGIIQVFLKDDRHLFSVDANSFEFERKTLGAALQIYLLGYQNAKAQERASAKQRLIAAINLLFE